MRPSLALPSARREMARGLLLIGIGRIRTLGWALTFFVSALIAAALGFTGLAGAASSIAQLVFFVFLVLLVAAGIASAVRGRPPV